MQTVVEILGRISIFQQRQTSVFVRDATTQFSEEHFGLFYFVLKCHPNQPIVGWMSFLHQRQYDGVISLQTLSRYLVILLQESV